MPIKKYIKDQSFDPIYKSINPYFYFQSKILSGLLMAVGFMILGTQVIIPLIFFKTQDAISKPISSSVLGVAAGFTDFEFSELKNTDDNLSDSYKDSYSNIPKYFYLTIPKLGIKDALIESESDNLSPENSLGHYKGSALPGKTGNSFIYGHSVLPWFFNPKNYKTIFSTLDYLEIGDELQIKYNNKEYGYKVESKEILHPDNVDPLGEFKPKYLNAHTVTLMTCHPAGTRSKRLLIRAVEIN